MHERTLGTYSQGTVLTGTSLVLLNSTINAGNITIIVSRPFEDPTTNFNFSLSASTLQIIYSMDQGSADQDLDNHGYSNRGWQTLDLILLPELPSVLVLFFLLTGVLIGLSLLNPRKFSSK